MVQNDVAEGRGPGRLAKRRPDLMLEMPDDLLVRVLEFLGSSNLCVACLTGKAGTSPIGSGQRRCSGAHRLIALRTTGGPGTVPQAGRLGLSRGWELFWRRYFHSAEV